jgi:uncharacterized phiE125 gp8 family phage protein
VKYELITGPAGPAVSLASAKQHMVVEHSADDELIAMYIGQAADWCAAHTGRHFGAQAWAVYGNIWCEIVNLPFSPVQSVVVEYVDEAGDTQTLAADQYYLDNKRYPATIYPASGVTWPTLGDGPNVVTVTCQTGADVIDGNISAAIYLLATHYYEQRSESSPVNMRAIPHGVTAALSSARMVQTA